MKIKISKKGFMRKIVYYVAISLDGFIAGLKDDISGFLEKSNGIDQYFQDLQAYDTVIMGRNTYQFGYQYGLKPGQPAYPHMTHYIFSNSLKFENAAASVLVKPIDISEIEAIQAQDGTDIYLCGGGQFAGWLLEHQKIDILKVKLNPSIIGQGIRLFGDVISNHPLQLLDTTLYENGLQIMTYQVLYDN